MSMRIIVASVIMIIIFTFTTANFFLSIIFTKNSMTRAMERELSLGIADKMVSTAISPEVVNKLKNIPFIAKNISFTAKNVNRRRLSWNI